MFVFRECTAWLADPCCRLATADDGYGKAGIWGARTWKRRPAKLGAVIDMRSGESGNLVRRLRIRIAHGSPFRLRPSWEGVSTLAVGYP